MNLMHMDGLLAQQHQQLQQPDASNLADFTQSVASSAVDQCEQNIQAADLLLQTGDTISALRHIKTAKKIAREMSITAYGRAIKSELDIKCRACHARILEADNKYLAASWNYYQIAQSQQEMKTEDETVNTALHTSCEHAIKCCILAKACIARDDLLSKLHALEQAQQSVSFTMLRHMYQGRIISARDQELYGKMLPLQDQLKLVGEYTILQKAVYEHNLRAVAKLYKNINLRDLAMLLGVSTEAAEDLTRNMITEKRLVGVIDQVDNDVTFDVEQGITEWDAEIKQLLLELNQCVEMIKGEET